MAVVVLLVTMFAMLFLGVPVGVCLILPIVPLVYLTKVTSMTFIANIMYSGVANYTLIAMPFFIICGNIMDCGGLSRRLFGSATVSLAGPLQPRHGCHPWLHVLRCGLRFRRGYRGRYWLHHAARNGPKRL